MANPKNRIKHLLAKAEKQYYQANVKLTELHDTLRLLKKEIQSLSFLIVDSEEEAVSRREGE